MLTAAVLATALLGSALPSTADSTSGLIVLCYHDIPKDVDQDNFGVDQKSFVNTIEYFRAHGFHFVSLNDVILAQKKGKPLAPKPVLLTFDDAYASYYDFVFPLLKEYRIPSVLAVVSGWIDSPPPSVKQKIMTWAQLQEVSKSPLVEIASHSHDLHKGFNYNPQGNEDAAAVARFFDLKSLSYEDKDIYQKRVWADILKSKETLESRLGIKVHSIAWPYGKYNAIGVKGAQKAGIDISLTLNDRYSDIHTAGIIERFLVYKNPELEYLLRFLKLKPDVPAQTRIMQIDLDNIYDEDPKQVERNLNAVLDRVKEMKVTTVYLQAFADPQGTGNAQSVYFPNRVLPVRMDLFNRVAHQLRTRSMVEVYAWMPMLSIILPDETKTEALQVKKYAFGEVVNSDEPYQRLSPFNKETLKIVYQLYEDLAVNAAVDGVLFQDDAYLTNMEDFSPDALKEYLKITGGSLKDPEDLSQDEQNAWTQKKTDQLIYFSQELMKAVRYYRPEARFARNLYPSVLTDPKGEESFAQNYEQTLKKYDYAVVMVYPYLEEIKSRRDRWFKQLVDTAKAHPQGLEKTVFKIQAFDWNKKVWLKTEMLNNWLEALVADGAYHLAYYPDDFLEDHPRADEIRMMMSTEDFPFKRK